MLKMILGCTFYSKQFGGIKNGILRKLLHRVSKSPRWQMSHSIIQMAEKASLFTSQCNEPTVETNGNRTPITIHSRTQTIFKKATQKQQKFQP